MLWWTILLFFLVALALYATAAAFVWPYARPLVSLWLIVLCIAFPFLFPFLLAYLLVSVCFFPVVVSEPRPQERVVVMTHPRGVVLHEGPPARPSTRSGSARV